MPHILLVDDDVLLRDALHKILVRAGYEVEDASGGIAALKAFQRQPRELVITDIVMVDGEGLDTIRALRKLDPHVKIIAMSGGGFGKSGDYLALAEKFGATTVLPKPFSGAEVLAVVAEVLARPSARDV
ncbi:MAG: response regulator [Vicinamibacterales bacterium]